MQRKKTGLQILFAWHAQSERSSLFSKFFCDIGLLGFYALPLHSFRCASVKHYHLQASWHHLLVL